jgi:hypothetical protein
MPGIRNSPLPEASLLRRYADGGACTDCFSLYASALADGKTDGFAVWRSETREHGQLLLAAARQPEDH